MIISKTPYRVSFFGGGTDFPEWFLENGGSVISTTIDKYCYISCRELPPFFPHKHRLVYSIVEEANKSSDIKHPAIRGVFNWLEINKGMEVHHDGDLPARSGIGSSSSFTVGLLNAMGALCSVSYGPERLAKEAIHVERNVIKEAVGWQDQIAAAYGGLNKITFLKNGTFNVDQLDLTATVRQQLNSHLLLFYTKKQRRAFEIEERKLGRLNENYHRLKEINSFVTEAEKILSRAVFDATSFGELLHQSWLLKRELSSDVSNQAIDQAYSRAIDLGAMGGKILGAGGGGFILFFAPPRAHAKIIADFKDFVHVPVSMEEEGSKIALAQLNGL